MFTGAGQKIHSVLHQSSASCSFSMSSSCRQSDGQQKQARTRKLHEWTMINFLCQHHQAESSAPSDRISHWMEKQNRKNWQLFSLVVSIFSVQFWLTFFLYFYSNLISSWFDCSVFVSFSSISLLTLSSSNEEKSTFFLCILCLARGAQPPPTMKFLQLASTNNKSSFNFIYFAFSWALWCVDDDNGTRARKMWSIKFLWKFHYWKRQNALERSDTTEKSALTRGKFFFSFSYIICCLQLEKFYFSRARALV